MEMTGRDDRDTHTVTMVLGKTAVPQCGVQAIIVTPQSRHRAGPGPEPHELDQMAAGLIRASAFEAALVSTSAISSCLS